MNTKTWGISQHTILSAVWKQGFFVLKVSLVCPTFSFSHYPSSFHFVEQMSRTYFSLIGRVTWILGHHSNTGYILTATRTWNPVAQKSSHSSCYSGGKKSHLDAWFVWESYDSHKSLCCEFFELPEAFPIIEVIASWPRNYIGSIVKIWILLWIEYGIECILYIKLWSLYQDFFCIVIYFLKNIWKTCLNWTVYATPINMWLWM